MAQRVNVKLESPFRWFGYLEKMDGGRLFQPLLKVFGGEWSSDESNTWIDLSKRVTDARRMVHNRSEWRGLWGEIVVDLNLDTGEMLWNIRAVRV